MGEVVGRFLDWGPPGMTVTDYVESKREAHLNELKEFLRIPSVSTKSEHKPDIERAAHWVADKLRAYFDVTEVKL